MKRLATVRFVRPAVLLLMVALVFVVGAGGTAWAQRGNQAEAPMQGPPGTVPRRQADLVVTKTGVWTGEEIVYTIRVINNGPSAANRVMVNDPIPGGTVHRMANPSRGRCNFVDDTLVCNLAALPVGQEVVVEWRVRVERRSITSVQNIALVTSPVFDPNTLNNMAELVLNRP